MNNSFPTEEERKQWWTLVFAHTSFDKCETLCKQMLDTVHDTRDAAYVPLAVTIHVFYCRPFMKQRGATRLPREYVPQRFRGLHDALLTFRDKVFAHSDSDSVETIQRSLNDMVYNVSSEDSDYFTIEPWPRLEHYRSLLELLPILLKKTFVEFHAFHTKYSHLVPLQQGDHLFTLKGASLFTPYSEPNSNFRFPGS